MFCNKCGNELQNDVKFCSICGAVQKGDINSILKHPTKKNTIIIGVIVLLIIFVCTLFGILGSINSFDNYNKKCSSLAKGDYENLLRYPKKYEGIDIEFEGEVLQVLDGELLVYSDTSDYWSNNDIICVEHSRDDINFFEGDTVVVLGKYSNNVAYETTMGENTVPVINAKYCLLDKEYTELLNK